MKKSPTFYNPGGFTCAPNQTDPTYQCEQDFNRFVAFGLLYSYDLLSHFNGYRITPTDIYELRVNFLDAIFNACSELHTDDPDDGKTFNNDGIYGIELIPVGSPSREWALDHEKYVTCYWSADRIQDNAILMTLFWQDLDHAALGQTSESIGVWLSLDALKFAESWVSDADLAAMQLDIPKALNIINEHSIINQLLREDSENCYGPDDPMLFSNGVLLPRNQATQAQPIPPVQMTQTPTGRPIATINLAAHQHTSAPIVQPVAVVSTLILNENDEDVYTL